jgi:UDP-3-O-[3-hydroxymyristoyl] glucosamine N-acyltransferase
MPNNKFFAVKKPLTLKELADLAGCTLQVKDANFTVTGINTLSKASNSELSFLSNRKYLNEFKESKAAVCVVEEFAAAHAPAGMDLLITANPYYAYSRIATALYSGDQKDNAGFAWRAMELSGVSDRAYVEPTATLASDVVIAPGSYIGKGARIGEGSYIGPNCSIADNVIIGKNTTLISDVTLQYSIIGDECLLHPGVRIGQDGFGFAKYPRGMYKVPQLGGVVIGDQVEIGANTTIDRGAIEDTVIGNQAKIDNLVQIGHNVKIGDYSVIVAQVGIAGSTEIGKGVVLGGQVGIAGHLKIGDGAVIAAQSGIASDVKPGETLGGSPAIDIKKWHRQTIMMRDMVENRKKEKANE